MKANAKLVFDYVKAHYEENITAADIAAALELSDKTVNGIITQAFQKKGLMERIPSEISLADGTHKAVKMIRMTAEGLDFEAEVDED